MQSHTTSPIGGSNELSAIGINDRQQLVAATGNNRRFL